jgi:hypothetical protein
MPPPIVILTILAASADVPMVRASEEVDAVALAGLVTVAGKLPHQ